MGNKAYDRCTVNSHVTLKLYSADFVYQHETYLVYGLWIYMDTTLHALHLCVHIVLYLLSLSSTCYFLKEKESCL